MFAVSVQSNAVESSTQADLLLDRLSAQHITDIFYYPWQGGAHCQSAFFSPSTSMSKGFDSLQYLLDHNQGIRIHVWFAFGADTYVTDATYKLNAVAFTNFGLAAARQRMAAIVADVVKHYPAISGSIFDYMRAPSHNALTYYTEADVTAALTGCVTALRGDGQARTRFCSFKSYKNNWTEWQQRYDVWYKQGLIDIFVPMCYNLWAYPDYYKSIESWTTLAGVPVAQIMPKLSVMDTTSVNEATYKTLAKLAEEVLYFKSYNFGKVAVFDQRATDAEYAALYTLVAQGDDTMGIYDTLIAQAAAAKNRVATLDTIIVTLQALHTAETQAAADLTALAVQYQEADALADDLHSAAGTLANKM